MPLLPLLMLGLGAAAVLTLLVLALSGPSAQRASTRRLTSLRDRHMVSGTGTNAMEAQLRRISTAQASGFDVTFARLLPNQQQLEKRLAMTGKGWTLGQYGLATLGLAVAVALLLVFEGAPLLLAMVFGSFLGLGLPHFVVSFLIKRRVGKFTATFPDAIDLLVRGLRSGLPITETIGVVGFEMPGPVGEEFRAISDKMKIGRTLDAALQETADRLGTPEFQFFTITIQIQRETGGNLAETLGNLSDVLRKRAQMKLKIKAMSSEAKASAIIVGALPFIVFGLIWSINNEYMMHFFTDQRLVVAGSGGLIWMALGAFIMAKMVNFEI
ncbi:type II secretion system F family protein [Sphingomonas sp.]|uniref:type II secretion system F family protein n=1 Tax=Sphingomonas sp. TaxID=28214 RepID=UPI0028B17BE7|nr:type II secretion system F family protein [Sphingomonas sp.]